VRKGDVRRLAEDIDARLDAARAAAVASDVEQLYRELPTVSVRMLLIAFTADRDGEAATDPTKAFCQARVDLLTRILDERKSRGSESR
jgi:hypothetical protein